MTSETVLDFDIDLKQELQRLAAFGANLADAHSCFIFFPTAFITMLAKGSSVIPKTEKTLRLAAYHTLSEFIHGSASIDTGAGLIGWVSQNAQPIHVSPFERDSRTLKIYSEDVELKSFMAVPIKISDSGSGSITGVLSCDSKKSFAFSKLQIKLLEQLADQVASTSKLALLACRSVFEPAEWRDFWDASKALTQSLGIRSVELLRLVPSNTYEVESRIGINAAQELFKQISRLIEQVLPPPRPAYQLPSGEILLLVDSMMSSFYENKIRALCEHVSPPEACVTFKYIKVGARNFGRNEYSLENLLSVSSSSQLNGSISGKSGEKVNERKWA